MACRFGNAIVDDWEGKVNAWPLDEGLIDFVDASYGGPSDENEFAALNVVANAEFTLSGNTIDARQITPAFLSDTLHKADGVEAVNRLRPVSLGVLMTVLGVLPLLWDLFFKSLAVVSICGLSFATILTFIVVPTLYAIFFGVKQSDDA